MSAAFGSAYAGAYDLFYGDKDYAAECDLIERLLREEAARPVRTILDLGCGTGNHAFPLAERGYTVTGVDRSSEMLAAAQAKLEGKDLPLDFVGGDVRDVRLARTFDATLMMFAVLSYQVENLDVLAALRTARRHLEPGGLLVLDAWYGPAVLAQQPEERTRIFEIPGGRLERTASGRLDVLHHVCRVTFGLRRTREDAPVCEESEEHTVRFFFPQELALFLDTAGFDLLRLGAFPEIDRDPDETTWNLAAVARVKGTHP